ncbi:MAG: malectin domain-containing carbohydrate-binding protein, partial [Planctomycetota bacterium]
AEDIDVRTDVYSLGVVLYELLVGELPIRDAKAQRDLEAILASVREDNVRRPSLKARDTTTDRQVAERRGSTIHSLQRALQGELDWITLRALEKDRADRYASVQALHDDVKEYLRGGAVQAGPRSASYRASKFLKRHRLPVGVGVSFLIVLVAGLVTSLRLYYRAESLRETEAAAHQKAIEEGKLRAEALREKTAALKTSNALFLAAKSRSLLDSNPTKAFLVALEAERQISNPTTKAAVVATLRKHRERRTCIGHSKFVRGVDFDAKNEQLLSVSDDGTLRVWNAKSGGLLATLTGHTESVTSGEISPDGKQAATGSKDTTLRVWDLETGRELLRLLGDATSVEAVAYRPGTDEIVFGTQAGTLRFVNATTGEITKNLSSTQTPIYGVAFDRKGARLAVAAGSVAEVWDLASDQPPIVLKGHKDPVHCVAFNAKGDKLVSGSNDHTARIWDLDIDETETILKGHLGDIYCVEFSPDDSRIATGSVDLTARFWDAKTGEEIERLSGHTGVVTSLSFSPDGQRLATGSYDNTVRIWDARESAEFKALRGHESVLLSGALSPTGRLALTCSRDRSARIWDAKTGQLLKTLRSHQYVVRFGCFSPDETEVVTASWDGTVKIWDVASGGLKRNLATNGPAYCAVYSPDGLTIVTGGNDRKARVWDAKSGAQKFELGRHNAKVETVQYSRDGSRIVTSADSIRIFEAKSGQLLKQIAGSARYASFDPEGKTLVAASDRGVTLWNAETGELLRSLTDNLPKTSRASFTAEFSPDGKLIAASGLDSIARIWDATTGDLVLAIDGHENSVRSVSFSHDSQWLLTTSRDATALLSPVRPIELAKQRIPRALTAVERRDLRLGDENELEITTEIESLKERCVQAGLPEGTLQRVAEGEPKFIDSEALAKLPQLERKLQHLGIVTYSLKQYECAAAIFGRALQAEPNDERYKTHVFYGASLMEIGKLDEAVATLEANAKKAKRHGLSHHYLGEALEKKGRVAEAANAYVNGVLLAEKKSVTALRELLAQETEDKDPAALLRALERLVYHYDFAANKIKDLREKLAPNLATYRSIDQLFENENVEEIRAAKTRFEETANSEDAKQRLEYFTARLAHRESKSDETLNALVDLGHRDATPNPVRWAAAQALSEAGRNEDAFAMLLPALLTTIGNERGKVIGFVMTQGILKGSLETNDVFARIEKLQAGLGDELAYENSAAWSLRQAGSEAIRINAGATRDATDAKGRHWSSDRFYRGGLTKTDGKGKAQKTTIPSIYHTQRQFQIQPGQIGRYIIPLPRGDYEVRLHFSERSQREEGRRRFHVKIDKKPVLRNYEPREAGFLVAREEVFQTSVDDSLLEIELIAVAASPRICGIEVIPQKTKD